MAKRFRVAVALLAVLGAGAYLAYKFSRLFVYQSGFAGSQTYILLFKQATWLIPVAALLGIYFGASLKRSVAEPPFRNGKFLRHDEVAFFEHWLHALATLLLIVTGTLLGFLFVPRLVSSAQTVGFIMNLHFLGVLAFLFGLAYYVTEALLAGRVKEHWPEKGDFETAVAHYMAKFGGPRAPEEGKYLASEKLSYPLWVLVVGGVTLTGTVKVLAHAVSLPGWVMGPATFLHDLAAFGVIASLAAHIVAAAVLPWSWPLLGAMLTGYVPEDYARKHHPLWYRDLKRGISS